MLQVHEVLDGSRLGSTVAQLDHEVGTAGIGLAVPGVGVEQFQCFCQCAGG